MRSVLARVFCAAGEALFPLRCRACGGFLAPEARAGPARRPVSDGFVPAFDGLLCSSCLADLTPLASPICTCCGTLFEGRTGEDHLCGRCQMKTPAFFRARAAGIYDGALLALVHGFKYQAHTELARPLALLMREAFHRFWESDEIDAVVAVPLHPRRLRSRGFNQAALLVRQWNRCGDGRRPPGPLLADALLRRRFTTAQAGLGRRQRATNIRGAFAPGRTDGVAGRRILLVDDVLTTGATADECSRVLTEAGAGRVDVLTLARSVASDAAGPDPGRPGTRT